MERVNYTAIVRKPWFVERVERRMKTKSFRITAVLFDFDGTLTKPEALDFPAFKKSIGCPKDQPVLEFIEALTDPEDRNRAFAELDRFEMKGAENAEPRKGAEDLISFLKTSGLRMGIISRNNRRSIDRAFQNFDAIGPADFDVILSRMIRCRRNRTPKGCCWRQRP